MSGFKTPTAMSPPRVQAKKPLIRSTSNLSTGNPQVFDRQNSTYPEDAAAGLMRAFEDLKSPASPQAATIVPRLPPIIHNKATFPRDRIVTDGMSNGAAPRAFQGENIGNLEALVGRSTSVSSPSPSTRRSSDSIELDRPSTAPHQIFAARHLTSPTKRNAAVLESPFKAYGHISVSAGRKSPHRNALPQPHSSPDLEIYKRHESNGRLMVCEAREEHCSTTVTSFLGEHTGLRSMVELKAELIRILSHLGREDQKYQESAKADLKVVTGNMLERIVAWDLNRAEALEQPDVPLLSTVPTAISLNKVDALYIIKMFRVGMSKIPSDDIRSKIGRLPDQDLMALLHFTFLISRPVLVWELDLDEI